MADEAGTGNHGTKRALGACREDLRCKMGQTSWAPYRNPMLAVIETHPVQYHAPVYRALQARFGVPVTAIYGSDFSVSGYQDAEFGAKFAWDTDLLTGYDQTFLSRVSDGGARNFEEISAQGLKAVLRKLAPSAVLILGYSHHFNLAAFYNSFARRRRITPEAEVRLRP
jgi:hypothetical protein